MGPRKKTKDVIIDVVAYSILLGLCILFWAWVIKTLGGML